MMTLIHIRSVPQYLPGLIVRDFLTMFSVLLLDEVDSKMIERKFQFQSNTVRRFLTFYGLKWMIDLWDTVRFVQRKLH